MAEQTHTIAKRGDLVCIQRVDSVTYAFGSGRGTERTAVYMLAIVTSVTRDGRVKLAERPEHAPWPWKLSAGGYDCHVLSAARLSRAATEVVAELARDFATLDELRAAVRPFVKAETAAA